MRLATILITNLHEDKYGYLESKAEVEGRYPAVQHEEWGAWAVYFSKDSLHPDWFLNGDPDSDMCDWLFLT